MLKNIKNYLMKKYRWGKPKYHFKNNLKHKEVVKVKNMNKKKNKYEK